MRYRHEQHLRRQRDIRVVREEGRRVDCQAFTVWWQPRADSPPPTGNTPARVSILQSYQSVGTAVQRTRPNRRRPACFPPRQAHLHP